MWPDIHYRILEMDPVPRSLALIGLLLLGSGLGCAFATALSGAGHEDVESSPAQNDRFAWQNVSVTVSLVLAGLLFLAVSNSIFN